MVIVNYWYVDYLAPVKVTEIFIIMSIAGN